MVEKSFRIKKEERGRRTRMEEVRRKKKRKEDSQSTFSACFGVICYPESFISRSILLQVQDEEEEERT